MSADPKPTGEIEGVMEQRGLVEISIRPLTHRVGAGQLLGLPAAQPHAVKAITRFKMILVMVRA